MPVQVGRRHMPPVLGVAPPLNGDVASDHEAIVDEVFRRLQDLPPDESKDAVLADEDAGDGTSQVLSEARGLGVSRADGRWLPRRRALGCRPRGRGRRICSR